MPNLGRFFNDFRNTVLTKFGPNPASMLIWTGVLGWFFSSAAQIVAIAANDKIPKEQKKFLIPQEIGDGAVNVLSFLIVTSAIKNLASKLVSTGKLATPAIREYLRKYKVNPKTTVGNVMFDISKMPNFDLIKDDYTKFKNGVDVVGMTIGSILSCNIITPIIRNKIASNRQRKALEELEQEKRQGVQAPKGYSMQDYLNNAYSKYPSGSLRI